MKHTLIVRQSAAFAADLLGRVSVTDLCLLDYLSGWSKFPGAKVEFHGGAKFVWMHYQRAIVELPIIFNPDAKLASLKNQLSAMIQKLQLLGLVETRKFGRRLFFRLTSLGTTLTSRHGKPVSDDSITTSQRDEIVMPPKNETITPQHDDSVPAIIDESGTRESRTKETPPISPSEGEAEEIMVFWNSFSNLPRVQTLHGHRTRQIRKRMADSFWRDHWREGITRLAKSDFLTGKGENSWQASLDWFLREPSLASILEGAYDRSVQPRQLSPIELKAQITAIDKLIETHPANSDSRSYSSEPTYDERKDLRNLRDRRENLLRLMSGVPAPGDG